MPNPITSPLTDPVHTRAPYWADVPDEKWMDWRWQMSHRLNSVEELGRVINLTESERRALTAQGLFRVDITPYFASLGRARAAARRRPDRQGPLPGGHHALPRQPH